MEKSNLNQNKRKLRKNWYRLDLSANVYPTLQRRTFSSVYRLSATLNETVDPVVLQQALEMTMPRFPTFQVSMRKGLFWRYLEPNHNPVPRVMPDISNPCMPMNFKDNGKYLIRCYYYKTQISLDVFHSLSDGNGALCLLSTLVAVYLRLQGYDIPDGETVLDIAEEPDPQELEDAYIKYAHSKVKPKRTQEKTFRVRGTREPFYTLNIVRGEVTVKQLKEISRQYQVTITEYLTAVLIYALQEYQEKQNPHRIKPIKIAMPVNLRNLFPSKTLRNFITMIYPGIDCRLGRYEFEEILKQIHHYMQYYINEKFLRADITTNAQTTRNPFIRIIPLVIKDFVVKEFYKRVQDKQSSAGLTNMGVVKTSVEMAEHLKVMDVLMGQPFSARTNLAIISYNGVTTLNFASSIVEADIDRIFFRKLVQDGIHVKIQSNRK